MAIKGRLRGGVWDKCETTQPGTTSALASGLAVYTRLVFAGQSMCTAP